jgi:hypothetical protein
MRNGEPEVSHPTCTRTMESALPTIIRGEYSEMPGLAVTLRQGARLWNAHPSECEQVLNCLVAAGFLAMTGESYVRADTGRRRA